MFRKRRAPFDILDRDDPANKRKVKMDPSLTEHTWESLLKKLGEGAHSLSHSIDNLVKVLELDAAKSPERLITVILSCIDAKPDQVSAYITLCGLLGLKRPNFATEFLNSFILHLQTTLNEYKFSNAAILIFAYFDLANIGMIPASKALQTINEILNLAYQLESSDRFAQPYIDWIVCVVLKSFLLVGALFDGETDGKTQIDKHLKDIGTILEKRRKIHVKALRIWSGVESVNQEEYIEVMYKQVSSLRDSSWNLGVISRPYTKFPELSNIQPIDSRNLEFPPFRQFADFSPPRILFRIFEPTDVKKFPTSASSLPPADSLSRCYLEDSVEQILIKNHQNVKECVTHLVEISTESKYAMDYIIVETVFSQMLRLPYPPCPLICYGNILSELCRSDPEVFPLIIAQAIFILFDRLNSMNVTCLNRFCNWFSFHLANVKCRWSWDAWENAVVGKEVPQKFFLKELFNSMSLIYYPSYLEKELPITYHSYFPKDVDGVFRFSDSDTVGHDIVKKIIEMIKTDAQETEIDNFIMNSTHSISSYVTAIDDDEDPRKAIQIDCIIQTLLKGGSKTISHTDGIFTKYFGFVKSIIDSPSAQVLALRSLYDFWKRNTTRLKVFVTMFLQMGFVETTSVVSWILHDCMKEEFSRFFVWDVINDLFSYVRFKKHELLKQIENCKRKMELTESSNQMFAVDHQEDDADPSALISKLEQSQKELRTIAELEKSTFLSVIQRIIILLTNHVAEQTSQQKSIITQWFVWLLQRLQQILITHHKELEPYTSILENSIFVEGVVEQHVFEIFKRWKSICG